MTTGDYYINLVTGTIQQQGNAILADGLLAAGFAGPYASIADAKAAHPDDVGGDISHAADTATGGVTGFLTDLTTRALWLRVTKIIIGLALVIAGVIQLTRAQALASTVAKGAVLA